MIRTAFILSALLASTCELGPFPKEPEPFEPPSPWDSPSDAGAPKEDDSAAHTPCYLACQRLKQLGCDAANPTAAGATCTQVCTNIESSGVVTMGPECVAHAASCSIASHCGQ